jgi:hypothetical protein
MILAHTQPLALLEFDAWLELSVSTHGMPAAERGDALERSGVSPAVFASSGEHWTRTIQAELARGDMRRAQRLGARFAEAQAARAERCSAALPFRRCARPAPPPPLVQEPRRPSGTVDERAVAKRVLPFIPVAS